MVSSTDFSSTSPTLLDYVLSSSPRLASEYCEDQGHEIVKKLTEVEHISFSFYYLWKNNHLLNIVVYIYIVEHFVKCIYISCSTLFLKWIL